MKTEDAEEYQFWEPFYEREGDGAFGLPAWVRVPPIRPPKKAVKVHVIE